MTRPTDDALECLRILRAGQMPAAVARLLVAKDNEIERLRALLADAEGHLVATQINARRATLYDSLWDGVAEAIQPAIDAIRAETPR